MIDYLDEEIGLTPEEKVLQLLQGLWYPTSYLRWKVQLNDSAHVYNPVYCEIPKPIFHPENNVKVLQQLWMSFTGKQEWRNIEIITE